VGCKLCCEDLIGVELYGTAGLNTIGVKGVAGDGRAAAVIDILGWVSVLAKVILGDVNVESRCRFRAITCNLSDPLGR